MLKLITALTFGSALLLGLASPPSPSYAMQIVQADDMSEAEGMMDEAPADDEMMEDEMAGDEMMDESPDGDDDAMEESETDDFGDDY